MFSWLPHFNELLNEMCLSHMCMPRNREVMDGPLAKSLPCMTSMVSRLSHFEVTLGKYYFFLSYLYPSKASTGSHGLLM